MDYGTKLNLISINFQNWYGLYTEAVFLSNLEVDMYLDSIVLGGLLIVSLTCAMLCYVGFYAYKHIKSDAARFDSEQKS